jgi:hypothetical protein
MMPAPWIILLCSLAANGQCANVSAAVNGTEMQCRALLMANQQQGSVKAACVAPDGTVLQSLPTRGPR